MQMQKMITMKENLTNKIKMIEQEIELYKSMRQTTKKSQLSRTTLS